MEETRSYRRRGTPDLPIAVYLGIANKNGSKYQSSEYHPEVEITQIVDGSMTMQIGGVSRTFHKGDIFIISPNTVHRRSDYSDDIDYRTLIFFADAIRMPPEHFFQKEFVQPLQEERLQLPELLQPDHPAYDTIAAQMQLLNHCRIHEKGYKLRRFSILMNICITLIPYCRTIEGEAPPSDPGNTAVKLCMRYIHNHYREKLTLEQIANYTHLHPNYLCALFKKYTGESVFDYLTHLRVETAANLLCREDLPVSKIAALSGFPSESLFYQKFKLLMGTTPKAYQKQHLAKTSQSV